MMKPQQETRNHKKNLSFLILNSQTINDLHETVRYLQPDQIDKSLGPRIQTNQIESKSGDSGDLFESGTLFQSNNINSFESNFTKSGTLLNPFCAHVNLTQDVESKLLEQIKNPQTCRFQNICKQNCQMKSNPAHTSVQKLLLYQLYENQVNKLKQEIKKLKQGSLQLIECEGQGCDFYFILNKNYQKDIYYCPLCLETLKLKN